MAVVPQWISNLLRRIGEFAIVHMRAYHKGIRIDRHVVYQAKMQSSDSCRHVHNHAEYSDRPGWNEAKLFIEFPNETCRDWIGVIQLHAINMATDQDGVPQTKRLSI